MGFCGVGKHNQKIQNALDIVDAGIPYGKNSAGLYRLRLLCYRKLNTPWPEVKKAFNDYLRLSDSDYTIRLLYAKHLIEAGDKDGASRQILHLRDLEVPYSQLLKTKCDLFKDGLPLVVEGAYHAHTLGKSYVYIDAFPRSMNPSSPVWISKPERSHMVAVMEESSGGNLSSEVWNHPPETSPMVSIITTISGCAYRTRVPIIMVGYGERSS